MKSFLFLLAMFLAAAQTWAEPLNQKKIHALYNEGEFDQVLTGLESYLGKNKVQSHEDSIFIFKHLAVVYSVSPNTREKGRFYMYRLLESMPYAQLMDMYVSEEIDRIFERVRAEYYVRHKVEGKDRSAPPEILQAKFVPVETGAQPPVPSPAKETKTEKSFRWAPEKRSVDFSLVGGMRFLDHETWRGMETLPLVGISMHYRAWPFPLALVGHVSYSQGRGIKDDPAGFYKSISMQGFVLESGLGARAAFEHFAFFQPFAEAGASYLKAGLSDRTIGKSSMDAGMGTWYGAGVKCRLMTHLSVAVQFNQSIANLVFDGEKISAGGGSISAGAGYHW